MSYEKDTKNAYRNFNKANAYKDQYTVGFKWARFTMWRQKKIIEDFLSFSNLNLPNKSILDVPCGAGYLGSVFSKFKAKVYASDISLEMMSLDKEEYSKNNFQGFIQADITKLPFLDDSYECSIILALMHRLPKNIRLQVLEEIKRVTKQNLIISYSVQNVLQKVKQSFIPFFNQKYLPAPEGISYEEILNELNSYNLKIVKKKRILSFLSAKVVFLIEV